MSGAQLDAVGRTVTSAQPYAWPYHGDFDATRCAMVACVDPAWRVARPASNLSDTVMRGVAAALREAGGHVIAVTAMPMRRPAGIPEVSQPAWPTGLAAEFELHAAGTSAFYGSSLDSLLHAHGYRDLLIAGWGLEGPVHSTMRAANDRGYECLLVPDACTTLEPDLAVSACEMVRFSGGIFGAFADGADVIAALAAATRCVTTDRSNR